MNMATLAIDKSSILRLELFGGQGMCPHRPVPPETLPGEG